MTHPYTNLPDHQFWSRAVSDQNPAAIDPVQNCGLIQKSQKLSTMGSCFAQHISREISKSGLNYFVPEQPETALTDDEMRRQNYGVFSARYGNIYTPRQALQLFQRAWGNFKPVDDVWDYKDRFVDPFRPRIQPDGFESPEAVRVAAAEHLTNVQRIFRESDWLVFTLGLTESWVSAEDGAVYPLAPGVAGGNYDSARYQFQNFGIHDVLADLRQFIELCNSVNQQIKILLTVSPVALVATYENRHVLTSTICSKSILRTAADEMEKEFDNVIYFPSYEIITSPASEGRYYQDDLREVTPEGVAHVMRVFRRHFIESSVSNSSATISSANAMATSKSDVVCDEEEIEFAVFGKSR